MSVTIKDVAARAGVSPKTVSRVVNAEAYVRPAVRAAVEAAIAALGYRPNLAARSLASARSYLIGLALDDPAGSAYAARILTGAIMHGRARGYHLVVEPVHTGEAESEAALIAGIAQLRLEGLILVPPLSTSATLLARLEAIALPYVRLAPGGDPARSALVEIDERGAAQALTRHLIALGHRDIGFIAGIDAHAATAQRCEGFLAAMREAGLSVPPARQQPGDFSFHGGVQAGLAMLADAADRPTAIFAANDDSAMGVIAAAGRLGIAVPDALSVVGFDDAPAARMAWPPITTVRQPLAAMAAAAIDVLADPRYRSDPADPSFRRCLPYEIVHRDSVAPAAR